MNIAKNMEAIFLACAALIAATSFASAAVPAHRGAHHATMQATQDGGASGAMQVVTISAKRLSS